MPRTTLVPITPEVLSWAIDESGYTRPEISGRLKVDLADLVSWERGRAMPRLKDFRSLARILRRQAAVFLLPERPQDSLPPVELRGPPGQLRSSLNPEERRFVRQISRIQHTLAWIAQESGELCESQLPRFSRSDDAENTASRIRAALGIDVMSQTKWTNAPVAFRAWREAIERHGVLSFLLPLGAKSARGLCLWDLHAPAVIINSAWNVEARIFTMFHEVGHVVTRTNSACIGYVGIGSESDRNVERWCDRFAASLLMPADAVKDILKRDFRWDGQSIQDLELPSRLARRLKVSLRASVLRLVDLRMADRSLYGQIPQTSDNKAKGGGGKGRTRAEAREDQFGSRVRGTFARAVNEELMTRADALTFLDIGDEDFAIEAAG